MNFQETYYRLKKGRRRVIMARLNLTRDGTYPRQAKYTWVLIPRLATEKPGKPHLQCVAWDNLELIK